MKLIALAAAIALTFVGMLFAGAGFFLLWMEVRVPPVHSSHVYIAAALIFLGGVAIARDTFLSLLKRLLGIVGPYVPWKRPSVAVKAPEPPVNDQ